MINYISGQRSHVDRGRCEIRCSLVLVDFDIIVFSFSKKEKKEKRKMKVTNVQLYLKKK